MARLFNGTSDNLSAAINLSSFSQLSLACWLWWDSYADDFDLAFEFTTDVGGTNGSFAYIPNNTGGVAMIYCRGTVGYTAKDMVRPSAAAWHHYVLEFDLGVAGAGAIVAAYVDGVSQTINMANSASQAGNFANSTLHFMSRATSSLFGAGRMAETAIYAGVLLNDDECAALAKGFSPKMIRPGNLEHYWPLIGRFSPEVDESGGANATVVGATVTEHPLVIYPAGPIVTEPAAVAGSQPQGVFDSPLFGSIFGSQVFGRAA
jgi:hypothetical protein